MPTMAASLDRQQQFHILAARTVDEPVDENQSYRREPGIDEQIASAAATLFEWSRPHATPPPHCIQSLRDAIPEVRRLE